MISFIGDNDPNASTKLRTPMVDAFKALSVALAQAFIRGMAGMKQFIYSRQGHGR